MKLFQEIKLLCSLFYRKFLNKNLFQKEDSQLQVHRLKFQPTKYRLMSHEMNLLPFMVLNNQEFHIKYFFFVKNELTIQNLRVL